MAGPAHRLLHFARDMLADLGLPNGAGATENRGVAAPKRHLWTRAV